MGILSVNINPNNLSSAVCDMYDIKDRTRRLWKHSKDEDNSCITVKDCIDDVIYLLEGLERQVDD